MLIYVLGLVWIVVWVNIHKFQIGFCLVLKSEDLDFPHHNGLDVTLHFDVYIEEFKRFYVHKANNLSKLGSDTSFIGMYKDEHSK